MPEKREENWDRNLPMVAAFAKGFELAHSSDYLLAEEMGVSHDQIRRWRLGTRIIPAWALDALAQSVESTVDELIELATGRTPISVLRAQEVKEAKEALEESSAALKRIRSLLHERQRQVKPKPVEQAKAV